MPSNHNRYKPVYHLHRMNSETKKILVPIGFSDQSIIALDQAAMFAKPIHAEIVMLSVIDNNNTVFTKLFSSNEKLNELKKEIGQKLEQEAAAFSNKHGLKTTTMVAVGQVYDEIARVADLLKVELVVMGTNGKPNNFKKRFIGSNAFRVVSLVEPPVVTVKGVDIRQEINTIVLPLVLERSSREKVGKALTYARLFNAKIRVVAVAKTKEEHKKLAPSLVQVGTFIRDAGVECSADMILAENKKVHESIFDYRKAHDGDLIIITEDGDDFKLGLGTTEVEKIIYGAEVPVMSITPSHTKFQNQFDTW